VGESELLRITPDATAAPEQDGVRTIGNPCLSGGTLEIFLEAMIPPVMVGVFGESPVARALERVGAAMDWDVRPGLDPLTADTSAVVVASHGRDELPVLRAALDEGVAYIALVASRKRAAGVLDELGATEVERARIQAPAGLDIGARSAAEIALSICAGIVASRPRLPRLAIAETVRTTVAIDPVCGMEVAVSPASLHVGDVYFCGPGCMASWRAQG
jgi:xanthine dehydrogenase accessory factor